jgi:hypothetical protein
VDSLDSQRLASLEVSKWRSGYYQLFRNSKVRNRRLSSRYLRPTCRSGHKVEELESRVSRRGAVLHNSEPEVQRLTAGSTQLIQSYGERWETRDAASENSTSFPCVEETSRVLFTCSWTVEQEELSTSVECVKTNKKRNVQLVLKSVLKYGSTEMIKDTAIFSVPVFGFFWHFWQFVKRMKIVLNRPIWFVASDRLTWVVSLWVRLAQSDRDTRANGLDKVARTCR